MPKERTKLEFSMSSSNSGRNSRSASLSRGKGGSTEKRKAVKEFKEPKGLTSKKKKLPALEEKDDSDERPWTMAESVEGDDYPQINQDLESSSEGAAIINPGDSDDHRIDKTDDDDGEGQIREERDGKSASVEHILEVQDAPRRGQKEDPGDGQETPQDQLVNDDLQLVGPGPPPMPPRDFENPKGSKTPDHTKKAPDSFFRGVCLAAMELSTDDIQNLALVIKRPTFSIEKFYEVLKAASEGTKFHKWKGIPDEKLSKEMKDMRRFWTRISLVEKATTYDSITIPRICLVFLVVLTFLLDKGKITFRDIRTENSVVASGGFIALCGYKRQDKRRACAYNLAAVLPFWMKVPEAQKKILTDFPKWVKDQAGFLYTNYDGGIFKRDEFPERLSMYVEQFNADDYINKCVLPAEDVARITQCLP